ncbi:transcriptional regulator [Corynebacterium sp.]|uniref:transcriptional regulator n=1 Tax=Corynebacterium sp. TaxID=1720 RepID=UPI0026DD2D4F|nr:transcriptional regulator [Corynebacterium sp.]MDO5032032.1 transcriptional regulator [Corynebacterium sp.]
MANSTGTHSISGLAADYTLKEIDRFSRDEFEHEVLLKTYAIGYVTAMFTVYCASAVLAWALPGALTFWALAPLVALAIAEGFSSRWMRKHIPAPARLRSWSGILLMLIPAVALFAGMFYRSREAVDSDFASGGAVGAIIGAAAVVILAPLVARWRHDRDEKRLNRGLED